MSPGAPKGPPAGEDDRLAREIDRLLKKLPMADPMLKGDPVVHAEHKTPAVDAARARAAAQPPASPRAQRMGVWARVLLSLGLGAGVVWWPYASECGFGLVAYLGVIGAVIVAGGWASVWSWRLRLAAAHVAALVLVLWGLVLGAGEILPRIGYAAHSAVWLCGAAR